jgi:hypothetical protein
MAEERFGESAACWRFDAELPAYLEGEAAPQVTAHARECRFCAVVLADLEELRSASRALPREEPSRAVWANIRAALAAEGIIHEPVRAWQRWFGFLGVSHSPAPVGALAGLLILASMLLVPSKDLRRVGSIGGASEGARVAIASIGYPGQDSDLLRTVQDLEGSFQARRMSLEPSVKAIYEKSLESLNTSIRECTESVQREPANILAREYLLAAYTRKAEVLASALEFDAR